MPSRSRIAAHLQQLLALCTLLACISITANSAFAMTLPVARLQSSGLAWRVQGKWRNADHGAPIQAGDPIAPRTLLQPENVNIANSITVLLPDGQRILNECFTVVACKRGFRVPSLTKSPSEFEVQMLAQIGNLLVQQRQNGPEPAAPRNHASPASQDEAVTQLLPVNTTGTRTYTVNIVGTLSALPNGTYSYDLRRLDKVTPNQFHLSWNKTSSANVFPIPAPGLYEITLWDALDTARVNVVFAAIQPKQRSLRTNFTRARDTLKAWDGDYYGWPVHILLRAYLHSLVASQIGSKSAVR